MGRVPLTYYRPPAGATWVAVRVDRPNRIPRYHEGARVDGELMVPEACNLGLNGLTVLEADVADGELFKARRAQLCRRCYPNGWRLAA